MPINMNLQKIVDDDMSPQKENRQKWNVRL